MSTTEFQTFPKIARLNRDIVITEKLDGTNAAVVIREIDGDLELGHLITRLEVDGRHYEVRAQSRTRLITPEQDNYGFAGWVQRNAVSLVNLLGAGTHFGEWWGAGIQRKYGLTGGDKRFSLFNTERYGAASGRIIDTHFADGTSLGVVPVLYRGPYDDYAIEKDLDRLRDLGSHAAPGFMSPEGIVVYHTAARQMFKVTLENDAAPKGAAGHALDEERSAA